MFSAAGGNWWRLIIWLLNGFVIYFAYGRKHSVMKHYLEHEISNTAFSPGGALVTDVDLKDPGSPEKKDN